MTIFHTHLSIEINGDYLNDISAVFEIETEQEECPQSGQAVTVVKDCELLEWFLGGLLMDRKQLVKILSNAEVKAIESEAGEKANNDLDWIAEVEA